MLLVPRTMKAEHNNNNKVLKHIRYAQFKYKVAWNYVMFELAITLELK